MKGDLNLYICVNNQSKMASLLQIHLFYSNEAFIVMTCDQHLN